MKRKGWKMATKKRTVVVTVELETCESLSDLKAEAREVFGELSMVRQVQVNVVDATKTKKKGGAGR